MELVVNCVVCRADLLLSLDILDMLVASQPNGVGEEDQLAAETNHPQ